MTKYLKIFLLSAAVIGLLSGSAFAAAALNAGNTKLAAELVPPAAAFPIAVNNAYETGGPIAATTTLKVSLTNAKFPAAPTTVAICESPAGSQRGSGTAAADATSVDILLVEPLASAGTVYTFQTGGCAIPPALNPLLIGIPGGTKTGAVATMAVDSVTVPGDPNVVASATILTVVTQFSATLQPVTSKLDFATLQKTFVPSGGIILPYSTALGSHAGLLIVSDETIPVGAKVVVNYAGACTGQLGLDTVDLTITGDLNGLAAFMYEAVTVPIAAADITAGKKLLTVPGGSLSICSSADSPKTARSVELVAVGPTGAASLATGTRTLQATLKGGGVIPGGFAEDLVAAGTASHIFSLDATQYYVQLIKGGPGFETYIKLQSKSTIAGSGGVNVQILAEDGSLVPYSAGTIIAGTPLTITGTDLAAAVVAAGKSVTPINGFAAVITVNAPNADVFGYANVCYGIGDCKRVPLKVAGSTIIE